MPGSSMKLEDAEYLQEKRQALSIIEDSIRNLESQLIAARDLREVLLKDIALFRASHEPISRLHRDILLHIFEQWDDDDTLLRNQTLCLVSKNWYAIVWNSALFWNPIVLRPTWKVHLIPSICRYAALCHRRTKDNPLDIIIDFSAIPVYAIYILQVLDENAERFNFVPSPIRPVFADKEAAWDITRGQQECRYSHFYEGVTKTAMRTLIVMNGDHIHRWRSLRITMPNELPQPAAHGILDQMQGNLKSLVEIDLQGRPTRSTGDMENETLPPPSFSSLQQFRTNQNVHFDRILVNGSVLRCLCLMNVGASLHFLNNASTNFPALLTLELTLSKPRLHNQRLFDPIGRVYLPRLTSLKLSGRSYWYPPFLAVIDAPNLVQLYFDPLSPDFIAPTTDLLSKIASLLIQTPFNARPHGTQPTGCWKKPLKRVLKQSTALVSLRIQQGSGDPPARLVDMIREVRGDGYPLRSLREITLVRHDEDFMSQDETHLVVLDVSSAVPA